MADDKKDKAKDKGAKDAPSEGQGGGAPKDQ